jgi:hypothetical protein
MKYKFGIGGIKEIGEVTGKGRGRSNRRAEQGEMIRST